MHFNFAEPLVDRWLRVAGDWLLTSDWRLVTGC
jgi:hypothetical protein